VRRGWLALLLACSARDKPDVPILNYHSVGEGASEYIVPVAAFEQQLDWLVSEGFRTISLHELIESRAGRAVLPKRAVILTFDDGKSDALDVVLPSLRKRDMRATFFIITGRVGEPGFLTWEGVRALAAAGMEIGSHTRTHPRLPDLADEAAEEELKISKSRLEAEIGRPVEALAYPYNSLRSHTEALTAAAGYRVAVAGAAHGSSDLLRLRRFPVTGFTALSGIQHVAVH
jgi:peptidoglycan/xylan/chitin deacetylase (PgdA/CDA1 family)